MKKEKFSLVAFALLCLGTSIALISCKKSDENEVIPSYKKQNQSSFSDVSSPPEYICGSEQVFDFYGGQTILQGTVTVSNDAANLYVTYTTTDGWMLGQTHLYVGTLENLPINKSNTPIPGQFPYKISHSPYVTTYTYAIPLSELPSCYIIAAHAETHKVINGQVLQSETAWSYGTAFPGTNRWGWYSDYCTQECNGNGNEGGDPGTEG